jgi:hypothetical protein
MASDLALYVMTPHLKRGHLADLLRGYEHSGFFIDDETTPIAQALIRMADDARRSFTAAEVFPDGPLKGRSITSMSTRMQTYALAKRLMVADPETQEKLHDLDDAVVGHEGTAFVITANVLDEFRNAFVEIGLDPDAVGTFLIENLGATAALIRE